MAGHNIRIHIVGDQWLVVRRSNKNLKIWAIVRQFWFDFECLRLQIHYFENGGKTLEEEIIVFHKSVRALRNKNRRQCFIRWSFKTINVCMPGLSKMPAIIYGDRAGLSSVCEWSPNTVYKHPWWNTLDCMYLPRKPSCVQQRKILRIIRCTCLPISQNYCF